MLDDPRVLFSLNPLYGVGFLIRHGFVGFLVLGSVFLTVTGAEALYADMGHFGRWPIQSAWLFLALPCLALNYLGQGAVALHALEWATAHRQPIGDHDWFFIMAPPELRLPLVILATAATIIASQAVITGAFSLSPAGDPAGPAAAHGHPPHLGDPDRPDLPAADQQHAAGRRAAAGGDLPDLRQPLATPTAWR